MEINGKLQTNSYCIPNHIKIYSVFVTFKMGILILPP